ncbi:Lrp/AsnC ligand binding domain-containing protein [Streptomyces sp. NPDC048650]|uniref:Lrp/AsnC ligand binding domain-containing protein n=1 Tax=Streptomyces sp. NPDC048650 TaxID=3365583 RepID=UPI00371E46DE
MKNVGRSLAREPEIIFVAAISGPYRIHAVAHCRDLGELFEFTSDRIGGLPRLQSMEVSPVLRRIKQAGTHATVRRPPRRATGSRVTVGTPAASRRLTTISSATRRVQLTLIRHSLCPHFPHDPGRW